MRKTVDILGVKVDVITVPAAVEYLIMLAKDGESHYVVTPNPEFVMQAQRDTKFKEVLNRADLSLPDGVGLLWAAKYLSLPLPKNKLLVHIKAYWDWIWTGLRIIWQPKYVTSVIPERVTGADMVWEISKLAAEHGWSIFLLGSTPGAALKAANNLQWLYPNLRVAGVTPGPPYESAESVIEHIRTSQPKFVFLAFTAQKQIDWIKTYNSQLKGTIFVGVGGALDFISGGIALNAPTEANLPARRSPDWLQDRGLEWLWRLFTQPWRGSRIKTAVFSFSLLVVKQKIRNL